MNAALIALGANVLFAALAFGARSWLQWRRTGSTGFRGISGRVGSAEWTGGALLVVAFVLAGLTPVAVIAGWAVPWSSTSTVANLVVTATGGALMALGFVGTLAAQLAMGDSWRIGVDASERTVLVERGLF